MIYRKAFIYLPLYYKQRFVKTPPKFYQVKFVNPIKVTRRILEYRKKINEINQYLYSMVMGAKRATAHRGELINFIS